MTTASIRKKLENYLQVADEKKIKAIYTLLEDGIEHENRITIKQYNQELEEAEQEYEREEYITNEDEKTGEAIAEKLLIAFNLLLFQLPHFQNPARY